MALVIGRRVLDEQPSGAPYQWRWPFGRVEYGRSIQSLSESLQRQADILVLRGLIYLEEGKVNEADDAFAVALGLWRDESSGGGMDFAARVVAQECATWLGRDR